MRETKTSTRRHLIDAVLQGGSIGHWVWYIQEDRFDYTDTWPESLNYDPKNFTKTLAGFGELIHPDDVDRLTAAFETGDQTNARYTADIRMRDNAGAYQHMRITGKIVERAADGSAQIASGAIENITEERERDENRRRLLNGMPMFVGLLDTESRVVEANTAAIALIQQDREDLIGKRFWEAPGWPIDPENTERIRAGVDRAIAGDAQNIEIAWHITDTITRYIDMTVSPLYDSSNELIGCIPTGSDVTARKEMERQEALLMRELQHRVKNTLAIVQGLASQIMRQAASKEDAAQTLSLQLQALAAAHDMLVENNWSDTSMSDIIVGLQDEHAFREGAITADGPPIKFSQKSTVMLTLALHELRANSIKYGALSVDDGQVEIKWSLSTGGDNRFEMQWVETGVEVSKLPTVAGFGSVLLLKIFPAEFRGAASFDVSTGNFIYAMQGVLTSDDS